MMIETVPCPTCGALVRVRGDEEEGTRYYVPVTLPELREVFREIAALARETIEHYRIDWVPHSEMAVWERALIEIAKRAEVAGGRE